MTNYRRIKAGRGKGKGGEVWLRSLPLPFFTTVCLCAFVPLCLFFIASCAPKKPQFERKNKTFFYSHHFKKSFRSNYVDISQFFERPGIWHDFHFNGNKDIQTPNVWGKPFGFTVKGSDKTAAFNAWIGILLSTGVVPAIGYIYPSLGTSLYVMPKVILKDEFLNENISRFRILSNKEYFDATNDAIVSAYLLVGNEQSTNYFRGKLKKQRVSASVLKEWKQKYLLERQLIKKSFDTLASLIDDDGHLSCCMIDGKIYNEMYSRHGLVVASLVYAYKILGKELYAEKAKKLADYFIERHYHKEGYFDNWISIGTDSEICTGLLEVYDITGDKKYLNICEQVAKYYDNPHAKMTHNPQGHKDLRHDQHIYSTVDHAEFVILLKNLYAFTKNKHYLTMARGILKDLEMCYDPKWKLYSHMCYWNGKHDDHFFAVIQAIIYIAML